MPTDEARMPALSIHELLVAIDAQNTNEHALRAAAWLAERTSARVGIVHAVGSTLADWTWMDDPRATARAEGLIDRAWRSTVRQAIGVLGDALPDGTRVEDAVVVRAGAPAEVVLDEARRRDADVIVLGFELDRPRLDFGSTARRVIAGAPRAVWLQKHAPRPIERLLVPIDLSKDSLLALASACELARTLKARVEVLHAFSSVGYVVSTWPDYPDMGALVALDEVRDGDRSEFERCMSAFDWRGIEHSQRFIEGEPVQAVLDAQSGADLIVLGTHGRSRAMAALLGSVAWAVLRKAHLPVLAIRHPERTIG
ncbi:MAG: universal stress protein [Planctomycetes bacterium]|nr:universal stress protein [Planctomycetota bacterium]